MCRPGAHEGLDLGHDILDRLSMLRENCTTDLREAIAAMAQGDLTVEVTPVTPYIERITNDEIGQVATAVNEIRDNTVASVEAYNETREALAGLVGRMSASAGSVAAASQQMASTSEQTGRAVGEIASAVGEVALGAQRQVQGIEDTRRLTDEVAQATSSSAREATGTSQAADEARRVAGEGEQAIVEATEAMSAVRRASAEATEAIRQLGEKSGQIGSIVDTITGISEQTNLLALNAAIEAARAGEGGRGFAVVADEVRRLAERSKSSAAGIAEIVEGIQEETNATVMAMEKGAKQMQSGLTLLSAVADGTAQVRLTTQQQRSATSQVVETMEQLSDTSRQVSATANQIASASASLATLAANLERTGASAAADVS